MTVELFLVVMTLLPAGVLANPDPSPPEADAGRAEDEAAEAPWAGPEEGKSFVTILLGLFSGGGLRRRLISAPEFAKSASSVSVASAKAYSSAVSVGVSLRRST